MMKFAMEDGMMALEVQNAMPLVQVFVMQNANLVQKETATTVRVVGGVGK